jgi:diguanylate cyclase (GGDEF)-like protein
MSTGSARPRRHSTSIGPHGVVSPDKLARTRCATNWRQWELWTLTRGVLAYVLAVEIAALGLTIAMISHQRVGFGQLAMLTALVGLGLAKEELTRRVEAIRRRYSDTPHQNMTSVWTFAAALLLPPGSAAVVVAALYTYLWLRIWSPAQGARAWKVVFSASAVTLSCHSATGIMHAWGVHSLPNGTAVMAVVIAILIYSIVNLGLVAGAIALMTTERSPRRLFGTPSDAALEYATLTIGGVAAALLQYTPWSVLLLIPGLVVLHRNVLVRQLEEAASSDPKTGLLNATRWRSLAQAELDRAKRDQTQLGILMIDLDQFKRINDGNGHLVGDRVLVEVATVLKQHTRQYDVLGRFGGDEFVLLCPGVDAEQLVGVAERIRESIEQLAIEDGQRGIRVTVSIGAAHYPAVGPRLEDLLIAADNALFAAKDKRRNLVVILRQRQPTVPTHGSPGDSSN